MTGIIRREKIKAWNQLAAMLRLDPLGGRRIQLRSFSHSVVFSGSAPGSFNHLVTSDTSGLRNPNIAINTVIVYLHSNHVVCLREDNTVQAVIFSGVSLEDTQWI